MSITIDELSSAFYQASCAWENVKSGSEIMENASKLQTIFQDNLITFQNENPDQKIAIDTINKTVYVSEEI